MYIISILCILCIMFIVLHVSCIMYVILWISCIMRIILCILCMYVYIMYVYYIMYLMYYVYYIMHILYIMNVIFRFSAKIRMCYNVESCARHGPIPAAEGRLPLHPAGGFEARRKCCTRAAAQDRRPTQEPALTAYLQAEGRGMGKHTFGHFGFSGIMLSDI